MRIKLYFLLILILSSCAIFTKKISREYPMKTQPDFSCWKGNGESGAFYYLWECYEGKRVLIYNKGSGFYWSSNYREEGECGVKTDHELKESLDIKNKSLCYEVFPQPFQVSTSKPRTAKLIEKNELTDCDFIGNYTSLKKIKEDAIEELKKLLTSIQAHAFTEPTFFEGGFINDNTWVSKGYVCYGWNKNR